MFTVEKSINIFEDFLLKDINYYQNRCGFFSCAHLELKLLFKCHEFDRFCIYVNCPSVTEQINATVDVESNLCHYNATVQ